MAAFFELPDKYPYGRPLSVKRPEVREFSGVEATIRKSAEIAYEELEAQKWIDKVRSVSGDMLDIDAVSEVLGVDMYRHMPSDNENRGCIVGIGRWRGLHPLGIYLNPRHDVLDNRLTFAHEVGHYFLDLVGLDQLSGHDTYTFMSTENFCDFFATQLAVPFEKIEKCDIADLPSLVEHFGVGPQPILYQLMLAGKVPKRLYLDTKSPVADGVFPAGKIQRACICLDCGAGVRTARKNVHQVDIPVYDFTSFEWAQLNMGSRCGVSTQKHNEYGLRALKEVNQHYGEWSDADEEGLRRMYHEVQEKNPYAFIHMDPAEIARLGLGGTFK